MADDLTQADQPATVAKILQCFSGAFVAGTIAMLAYRLMLSIAANFAAHPIVTDNPVTGFIMAAAYPGAGIASLARRLQSRTLAWVAMACVPVAAVCFGTFFILMEVMPVYTPNVIDFRDLPGSVFGLACGTHFGLGLQRHMEQPAQRRRSEARASSRHR